MRALGGPRISVVGLFGVEAFALALAGTALGLALCWLLAETVSRTAFEMSAAGSLLSSFPTSLATSVGLAILGSAGSLAAVYRMNPAQSMRGE